MIYSNEEIDEVYNYEEDDFVPLNGLNLSESDVSVTYMRYINNHKNTTTDAQPNDKTVDDAVKNGLTPGQKSRTEKNTKSV